MQLGINKGQSHFVEISLANCFLFIWFPVVSQTLIRITMIIMRRLLGLEPTLELYAMTFADLGRLVYRDVIKQKHDSRNRLNQELCDKKQREDAAKTAFKAKLDDAAAEAGSESTVASLLLDHLMVVTLSLAGYLAPTPYYAP